MTHIIDSDVHPAPNWQRVQDFLAEPWRTRLTQGNRSPGGLCYWNPHGVMRADAVLADGARIEASPESLAKHHLDRYDVAHCVLNSAGTLSIGMSPEADYPSALLAAVNDHYLQDWLPVDDRFRYSLLVYPENPERAVAEIHRHGENPGVVQVLMPSATARPYGNRFYWPIYEAACVHDLTVAIHPSTEGVGISAGHRPRRGIPRATWSGIRGSSATTSLTSSASSRKASLANSPNSPSL